MQKKIDKAICDFIAEHHVMTLATADDEGWPYCADLFYAFLPEEGMFVFTSSPDTLHARHMALRPVVAGSVVLETRQVGLVRGLQWRGRVFNDRPETMQRARKAYLKAFPYAVLAPLHLWCCELTFAKYTDNRLGFGKKLVWTREAENEEK